MVAASTGWTAHSILAALCGPIWGFLLDNTSTRYGRYFPYHVILCFSWLLVSWGLLSPPSFILENASVMSVYYVLLLSTYGLVGVLGNFFVKT